MQSLFVPIFLSIALSLFNVSYKLIPAAFNSTPVSYAQYGYGNSGRYNDDDRRGRNDDDDRYNNDDDDDSNEIPLDGGLSVLAVAGAGFGIMKIRDVRAKKKKQEEN